MKKNESGEILTKVILEKYNFIKEELEDRDGDPYTTWYKDELTLYEEPDCFLFAIRTREDGSLKSGHIIKTTNQLENLYYALNDKELKNGTE